LAAELQGFYAQKRGIQEMVDIAYSLETLTG
jgi:hypothetical protein